MNNKKITREELDIFLRKHELWLDDDPGGERADLCGANLSRANLYRANLYRANLSRADLCEADLRGANLYRADLRGADLRGANLSRANLYRANLYRANLYGANLYEANLCEANLYRANLCEANLYRANLCEAENVNYPISCPEEGSFIAYKKACGYIIKLKIPEDALRCSATSRKCRCSKAEVLSITNLDGSGSDVLSVNSSYDSNFVYTVGETVAVDDFEQDRWKECSPGIHFFITRQEAVDY